MVVRMNALLSYRGRTVTDEDLAFLQQLLADQPTLSRRALSQQVCQAWNWRQPNGVLKDAVCRGLLLRLHREGHLQLPAPRRPHTNRAGWHRRAPAVPIDCTPLTASLADLLPLSFCLVRRTAEEPLFKALLHEHHELGYTQPVGEHLKYLVFSGPRVVAALAWSSAAHGLICRDRFLGWSLEAKRRNRHLLAYNSRFLIPPWIRVPHLASHVLGRIARRLSQDWEDRYHHPIYFLETFVDPARHRGSCYRAANWIVLGETSGRGHRCPTFQPNRPVKLVLGYPLVKSFRELLGGGRAAVRLEPGSGHEVEPGSDRTG
jgi:hypothetical protein